MVYVILVMLVMTSIAFVTLESIQHEQSSSATQTTRQTAYQAAEAGINDYLAKLYDDPQYYSHYLAAAESTRRDIPTSANVAASTPCTETSKPASPVWPYATNLAAAAGGSPKGAPEWSYPNGKDRWCQTANGYEYNLQITPPTSSAPTLTILATGRKPGTTSTNDYRVIQQVLSPNSITRYYRIVDHDVGFGSTTTTNGQVWANGSITHSGIATASLWAVGSISGGVTLQNGATANPNRSAKINFSAFLASITDISRAAQVNSPTTSFDDSSKAAWKLVFNNAGTYTVQSCTKTGGNAVSQTAPTCGTATTYTVPTNGAIYSPQDVIVSGTVKGRVTVASNSNIVLADAINPLTPGTDVIGLDAQADLIIAQYVPSMLTWNASVLAQTGTWHTNSSDGSHSTMTFTGSATTADGGDMTMFNTRNYGYDDNLKFLTPPWFPSPGHPWITTLFRELPAA